MKLIDESRLEIDLAYRFEYLAEFIGFTSDDSMTILSAGPYLGPLIPALVDKTYERLLAYTCTARHFVARQAGFDGATPADVTELTAEHPQIQFRKEHLVRYFTHLLTHNHDARLSPYLDMVGKIHTPAAGNPEIAIPQIHMNALMGLMGEVLQDVVHTLPLSQDEQRTLSRALGRLLWIQNDFINRHFTGDAVRGK